MMAAMPALTPVQAAIMRRLCAQTGMDGYAAAVVVADVGERSTSSPWWDTVRPAIAEMYAEIAETSRRLLEEKAREWARSLQALGEAIGKALIPVLRAMTESFHALSAALMPREHRRCVTCHPGRKPKPLAVNGHEYRRRQLNRRKRGR
jgi:hypothetical protein